MIALRSPMHARPTRPVFTLALLLALGAVPAEAQFGSLLKKAAEKATEKAVDKATGAEDKVSPRVNGSELTDEALGRLLTGLAVTADKLAQREQLEGELVTRNDAIAALQDKNRVAINAWQNASATWSTCFSEQWSKMEKGREATAQVNMMKVMSDPKKAMQLATLQQKLAEEQQKAMADGDTLAVKRLTEKMQADYWKLLGVNLAADSAKVRATCGAEPKKLAAMVQLDSLEARRDTLQSKVRELETMSQIEGAKAARMELQEYALQREKATTVLNAGNGGGFVTRDELNRLRAKRAELLKVKRAL